MKSVVVLCIAVLVAGCQGNEPEDLSATGLTGNEVVYPLEPGSQYAVSGTVTLRELTDGGTRIEVEISGTTGELYHPLHLHAGAIGIQDAPLAASLNPVYGKTGRSSTDFYALADEKPLSFAQLKAYAGSIKIHLASSGPEKDIILAGGNIGNLYVKGVSNGRSAMGVCGFQ